MEAGGAETCQLPRDLLGGGGDKAGEHEAGGERAPANVAPRSVGLGDKLCAHTRQHAGGRGTGGELSGRRVTLALARSNPSFATR